MQPVVQPHAVSVMRTRVEGSWAPASSDSNLAAPPPQGRPAFAPAGADLDLRLGWDRFEQFVFALMRRTHGARDFQFRRYGVQGQAQHGIDLAGRMPDGSWLVAQCKDYIAFTASDLRSAVETFAVGTRPFGAQTFIVVTSASTQTTQCADELAVLQEEHPDLVLDLWGSEQINERLRDLPDVVGRFWTRETADAFCTGAPLPGIPAPPLDRQQRAERILLGPLSTTDVAPVLREAEALIGSDPVRSAQLFGEVAQRLHDDHFLGHAFVLRRRQLEVLASAARPEDAVALAGGLTATALMRGDRDAASELARRVRAIAEQTAETSTAEQARHVQLIEAAVYDALRPIDGPSRLEAALPPTPDAPNPPYHSTLVLLLAEDMLATDPGRLSHIDVHIQTAIADAAAREPDSDLLLQLRLVRAEYDADERLDLNIKARRYQVPRRAAALIASREARRCANDGRTEDALDGWRDAVSHGIESDLDREAAGWLYSIRALNSRYGPLTDHIDDEHRLAQALRATATGTYLHRVRSPREAAMAALVSDRPIESVLHARRWLIDACITGAWASEVEAITFLADRYAQNREPLRAALLYQRAGDGKKIVALAEALGDTPLPFGPLADQPWWVASTILKQVSAQEDLLPAEVVRALLRSSIALARRGQVGELIDSPFGHLATQSIKTTCELAHRGSSEQAVEVLELLAPYVERQPNHGWSTDKPQAGCCVPIAIEHPTLAYLALTRLIALAAAGSQDAQKALLHDQVRPLITGDDADQILPPTYISTITPSEREDLRSRIIRLAEEGQYLSDVALQTIVPDHDIVQHRARVARDRILNREDPRPGVTTFGTGIPSDSYLVSLLPVDESQPCLDKLLFIATDPREAALNRQDALIGARNLVIDQAPGARAAAFETAWMLLSEAPGPSALDQFTGTPHPLSALQVSMGSASLRGEALRLAHAAIAHDGDPEQERRILRAAIDLFNSTEGRDHYCAALTIHQLPHDVTTSVDAALLASRDQNVLRQVAATLTVREPDRYVEVLLAQAHDHAHQVRRTLAEAIARLDVPLPPPLAAIRDILITDIRHSVRRCFDRPSVEGA